VVPEGGVVVGGAGVADKAGGAREEAFFFFFFEILVFFFFGRFGFFFSSVREGGEVSWSRGERRGIVFLSLSLSPSFARAAAVL